MRELLAVFFGCFFLISFCCAEMVMPSSITLDNDCNIYVISGKGTWRFELQKYASNGKLLSILNKQTLALWESDFDNFEKMPAKQIKDKFASIVWYFKCQPTSLSIKDKIIFPKMICSDTKNNIFTVGDDISSKRIKFGIFDRNDGHPIKVFDVGGEGPEQIRYPQGIAVDKDGTIYITNYWDHKVKVFDNNGRFIRSFGGKGSGDGQFKAIRAIAIDDKNGFVYVTDDFVPSYLFGTGDQPYQMRVQKFTKDGRFVKKWGKNKFVRFNFGYPPIYWEPELHGLKGIAVDSHGYVYVLTSYTREAHKFTGDGKLINKWGKVGSGEGEMRNPQAIAIDKDDNVYVADTDNNRIQKFDSNGKFLMEIK
ncbi:MAG: 6-bladed beta-propeller [Candidatus Margulisiibacteriota bacterium]